MSCYCYSPDLDLEEPLCASPSSDPGPLPKEHYEIQKTIAHYEAKLSELKYRQNTLIRICQLPPEVLSLIFATYAAAVHCSKHPLRWIGISHVCRHFRAVALESPRLWSTIYLGSLEGYREMLTRSKNANLVLKFRQPKSSEPAQVGLQVLNEALAQMHRIQTLNVEDASSSQMDAVVAALEEGAPRLQNLSVHKRLEIFGPQKDFYRLPPNFIGGGAPQLRQIELKNCTLPWQLWHNVPKFFTPSLTVLVLSNMSMSGLTIPGEAEGTEGKPLLANLLDLLEASPALRRLEMHNTLPTTGNNLAAIPLTNRVISLSQLEKLSLRGLCLECIGFLRAVSFPEKTKIDVESSQPEEWLAVCSTLMNTLFNCRGCAFKPQKMFVNRIIPSSPSFWIQMWDEVDRSNLALTHRNQCSLDVNIHYNPQPVTAALTTTEMFRAIFDKVDFNGLRELVASSRWNKHIWGRYFGNAPNLTHIYFAHPVATELAEAMVPLQTSGTQSEVWSKMPFRHLRTLSLTHVKFGEHGFDLDKFRDTLMLRAAYGSDLHQFFVEAATDFDKFDVDFMEEVVAVVYWDGFVDFEAEDSEDYSEDDEEDTHLI